MGKYNVDIKWLAVTSFEMRFDDLTVVSDPYITECVGTDVTYEAVENCDIITLGHAHWDHITDIPRLCEKFKPLILCGDMTATPLAKWLNYTPSYIYPMYPNLELDFDSVKIRALFGRHKVARGGMGFNDLCDAIRTNELCVADAGIASLQEVGTMEYRNYLFTARNGTKILLWGNDVTPEQINMCRALQPDIAILQRAKGEKELAQTVEFAAQIGCKVVIPHHHDFTKVDDPAIVEEFKKAFLTRVPDGTFVTPKHGEWIHL